MNRVQRVRKICAMYTEKEGVSEMNGAENYARYTKVVLYPMYPPKNILHIYIYISLCIDRNITIHFLSYARENL